MRVGLSSCGKYLQSEKLEVAHLGDLEVRVQQKIALAALEQVLLEFGRVAVAALVGVSESALVTERDLALCAGASEAKYCSHISLLTRVKLC